MTEWCGFWIGATPPTFLWNWVVPPTHRRSSSPTVLAPTSFPLPTPGDNALPRSGQNPRKTVVWLLDQAISPTPPHTPDRCRVFPSHSQIVACLGLVNSADFTLMTP